MPKISGVLINAAFCVEKNVFVSDGLASSPTYVSARFMNYKSFLFLTENGDKNRHLTRSVRRK